MSAAVGEISLAIAIVDECVTVVRFIKDLIQEAKNFGDAIRILRKSVAVEAARLHCLSSFLKRKIVDDKTRFQLLPEVHQSVILGMIQELEIIFFRYSIAIAKYNIKDLQRGYELETGPSAEKLSDSETLRAEGVEMGRITQEKAKLIDKATWALFKQKKVSQLVSALESWNNKLMNFLICGIYFLDQPEQWQMKPDEQEERNTM